MIKLISRDGNMAFMFGSVEYCVLVDDDIEAVNRLCALHASTKINADESFMDKMFLLILGDDALYVFMLNKCFYKNCSDLIRMQINGVLVYDENVIIKRHSH